MKKILFAIPAILLMNFAVTIDKQPYTLFNAKGAKTNYDQLLAEAKKADIVLFGELHDNPICHWLQRELTEDLLAEKKNNLVLGAEMFEADDQIALNEYLAGKTSEKTMKDEVKLWTNFATDYKPLLDEAIKNNNFDREIALKKELENLENICTTNEKTIDQMVYKLYDLTQDEIKIVENKES